MTIIDPIDRLWDFPFDLQRLGQQHGDWNVNNYSYNKNSLF